ncbi:phage tail tape measure protein [Kitasatospora xanthocidica]|uniref:phage tail tape measure protein n=1 Tax=Kitasatospora xanthocidica TaxID=83382 RepID=UPI0036E831CA
MTNRTVNVRLSLDTAAFQRGAGQAEQDSRRLAVTAQAAARETQVAFNQAFEATAAGATAAMRTQQGAFERGAQAAVAAGRAVAEAGQTAAASTERVAVAAESIPATFRSAAAAADASLSSITTDALGTSQALSRTGAVTVNMSAAASEALAGLAASAGGSMADVAAASARAGAATRAVATSAEAIPATFRAAAAVGTASMGEVAAASTRSSLAIGATSTALTEANLAAATGVERLSLASRLALAQAMTAATAVTAETTAATAATMGLGARMAASGSVAEKAFGAVRTSGLLMLGMFAAASYGAAKFEKSMSGVRAVADASAEQFRELRSAALEAGRDTAYTASQAADAEGELARAGVSVANITGGALKGALSLAAAGQLDLAESATIAAQSMNTFGLRGADVTHIADVLASGANKSAADVHGLGESLRMGGLLAHQTGLSFEDTVGTLSAFADHALIGSDAGTSLKVMLQRLVPQSAEARGIMDRLGFAAYDASGNFVGLSQLAGNLKTSFTNLTPEARNAAFATIFGSDAVRSATILYELGADGIDKYRDAVNDQGAASRMASVQLDNLSGDLQMLKGSLEVALIEGGTAANSVLRDMVQWITKLVNAWTALPPWMQVTTVAVFGIGGALAVLAGGFMLVLPRIAAFQASLVGLAETMPRLAAVAGGFTSFMTGPWGIGLAVASAALAVFGLSTASAKEKTMGLTEAVKADSNAVGDNVRAWLAHKLETDGVLKASKDLGVNTADLTAAILGNADALARVRSQMAPAAEAARAYAEGAAEMNDGNDAATKSLQKVEGALSGLTPEINNSVAAAKREAEASGAAADSTKGLGAAARTTAADIGDTRTAVEKLNDSLDALNGKNISAAKAAISMQASLADLKDKVKENGRELDITTEKGRNVKSAFLDAAAAAQAHAEAVMKQTGSTEQATIVLGEDIEALKRTMKQAGFTQTQIESLTQAYAQLPPAKETRVTDPGAVQTIKDLQDVKAKVEDVPPGKTVTVRAPNADAIQALQAIGYTVEALPGGKDVKVTVPTNDAANGTARIQQAINSIQGRTVTVNVSYVGAASMHQFGDKPNEQAYGSVRRYANGGVRAAASGLSAREAMMSSRPILWAEAGPEAYIPLDPAKRGRSMALLGEVAGIFGQQLMPARPTAGELIPAQHLAGPVSSSAGGDVHRSTTINLYGAQLSADEQLADLVRRQEFIT